MSKKNFINTDKNRGMELEQIINKSNLYYVKNDIAYIYKKHTPINIVQVVNAQIKKAFFSQKSTTDYNGIYRGFYLDFDAKSTLDDKFFLSTNLHSHQYQHLLNIAKKGGIGFLIVFFKTYYRYFLITINQITSVIEKHLTLQYFEDNCIEIKESLNPQLDYLKAVDLIIERNEYEQKSY